MCIIAICKTRKLTVDEMDTCWRYNDDGAGVAWASDGRVMYKKGFMTLAELKEWYKEFPIDIPHSVHFRQSTAGGVIANLTHPFVATFNSPISLAYDGDSSVLMHNGVVSDWRKIGIDLFLGSGNKIPSGEWNDTRMVACGVGILGEAFLDYLDSGKWVLITPEGIKRWGTFEEENGVMFSNGMHKSYSYTGCGAQQSFRDGGKHCGTTYKSPTKKDNVDGPNKGSLSDYIEEYKDSREIDWFTAQGKLAL